jgi:hypothetical protein
MTLHETRTIQREHTMCKHDHKENRCNRFGCLRCRVTRAVRTSAGLLALAFGFLATTAAVPTPAQAQIISHGIQALKGCVTPLYVGGAYTCKVTITNVDEAEDTIVVTDLTDVITRTPKGPVASGSLIDSVTVDATLGATCTPANTPRTCTLPFGGKVVMGTYTFYSVETDDPTPLKDTATVSWSDQCDGTPGSGCNPDPQSTTAPASAVVLHPSTHLTVNPETTITAKEGDLITISVRETNTGDVTLHAVHVVGTNSCADFTPSLADNVTLAPNASQDFTCSFTAGSTGFHWTATGHGLDTQNNPVSSICPSDTTCEVVEGDVALVDANIQITPNGTNEIVPPGTHVHTFTAHVNVNPGTGFVNAPDGTVINIAFVGIHVGTLSAASCTTSGGTGSCTVTDSSPTTGVDTVRASTTVTVGGIPLDRATGDTNVGDGPDAVKHWVNANIQITPYEDDNPVHTNHTLTGHVNVDLGDGNGFVNAPAGTKITFTLPTDTASSSFVGDIDTCTTVGTTGSCTVQITSPTPGTTTIHAATEVTVTVNTISVTMSRETDADGTLGNSDNATKHWVATHLTLISPLDNPLTINAGESVTITVQETNLSPDRGLQNVSVTGTGCSPFAPVDGTFDGTLAAGASEQFTCTFSPSANTSWTATGHADDLSSPPQAVGSFCTPAYPDDSECEVVTGQVNINNPVTACRMTGGHVFGSPGLAGLNINDAGVNQANSGGPFYTTGGQIGAPNETGCKQNNYPLKGKCVDTVCTGGLNGGQGCASNDDCPATPSGAGSPLPWGEWQHNHHAGPDDIYDDAGDTHITGGAFSFHSGTASAPPESYIRDVACKDEGWCVQARPAPDKQIFWEGVGVFHNLKGKKGELRPLPVFPHCDVQAYNQKTGEGTLHFYKAHVGDFGEPAGRYQKPIDGCSDKDTGFDQGWSFDACNSVTGNNDISYKEPVSGKGTEICPAQSCSEDGANLTGCPDWYDITIYCGSDPADPGDVIYHVGHFIDEGNFQIHPPVGDTCNPS